jgi:hypothetical protein
MSRLRDYFVRYASRPHVRPWALLGPVAVLMIALPMLRPLLYPGEREVSFDESALLASIRAVGETGALAVPREYVGDGRRFIWGYEDNREIYGDHPPVLPALLGGAYRLMMMAGLRMEESPVLVPYLLTVLGSTLPVAFAAGVLYRLGRLFEIPRRWRALFGLAATLASGLICYATVLNPHAPAAALMLTAVAALVQVATSTNPARGGGFVAIAGFCAALSAVIDPHALLFLVMLLGVVLAVRWKWSTRIAGVLLYCIGATPPIVLHATLNLPITGDLMPGYVHTERAVTSARIAEASVEPIEPSPIFDDDEGFSDSTWLTIGRQINRLIGALFGSYGLLSHFPVLVVGVFGVFAVMHRHWPATTKTLAAAALVGTCLIVLGHAWVSYNFTERMFASRAFAVCSPLLLLWAGAWLRRPHHMATYITAGVLLALSTAVALAGATQPLPRGGYHTYTAAAAMKNLFSNSTNPQENVLVGR